MNARNNVVPNRDPHLVSIDPQSSRFTLAHRIGGVSLAVAALVGLGMAADAVKSTNSGPIASAEAITGNVDGVITGRIVVASGNNLRTSPNMTPSADTPGSNTTITDNIYGHKAIPKGKVFVSDYAEQQTDKDGRVWFGMPVGPNEFVWAAVSTLDTADPSNVTVNGVDALSTNPNHDFSIVTRDGSIQLVDSQGRSQNIPAATFIEAPK